MAAAYPSAHPNFELSSETTPQEPGANETDSLVTKNDSANGQSSKCFVFVYCLCLLAEFGADIYYIYQYSEHLNLLIYPWISEDVNVTAAITANAETNRNQYLISCIVLIVLDTFNCWVFLGIIFSSIFKRWRERRADNPADSATPKTWKLAKFWFLILFFVMYFTGTLLLMLSPKILPHDIKPARGRVLGNVFLIVNAVSMVIMVVFLNHVKLKNLVHDQTSRYKYFWRLVLLTFLFTLSVSLITSILTINSLYVLNNSGGNREQAFTSSVAEVLMMPFNIQLAVFIATKIFHDDKSYIGQYKDVV